MDPSRIPSPFAPPAPEIVPEAGVVERVRAAAAARPDAEALVCGETRLTWRAFDEQVSRAANALRARGVRPGDRVAVLSYNSAAYAIAFMGVLRAGACLVPLPTMAAPDALGRMAADSGATALLASDALRPLAGNVAVDRRLLLDGAAAGWDGWDAALAAADAADPHVPIAPPDLFNIIYSSGTTGSPKGIVHDHAMRAVQMARVQENGYGPDTRTLLSTPLYSNTTIVAFLPTLVAGGAVVLMERFDARGWLKLAQRERVTHTMLVPVQYRRLMDEAVEAFDLHALTAKFSTSAPLRADLKREVLARMPGGLTEYYGLTEGGGVTVLRAHEHPHKLHTVGQPAPGVELAFVADGRAVARGETGEVCGRSPAVMRGYHGRDDLTEAVVWRDEAGRAFFRSGDLGHMDADGFVVLSDRIKDVIISGGLNIYADDLERALLAHPDVADAAAIGVPSDRWGETPLGLVVLRAGATAEPDAIRDAVNAGLGKAQRLSAVELRDALPRSPIGKILKRELRAPYWGT